VYLTDVSGSFHGSDIEGCENLIHWHGRDINFSRGKSRILITFRDMEEILSNINMKFHSVSCCLVEVPYTIMIFILQYHSTRHEMECSWVGIL
jgi:hypothetical protein